MSITYQRAPICIQVTNSYFWNELADRHDKKIEVEKKLELLKQHLKIKQICEGLVNLIKGNQSFYQGQKRKKIVFLVSNSIGWKVVKLLLLFATHTNPYGSGFQLFLP